MSQKNFEDRKKFSDLLGKSGYLTTGTPGEKFRPNIFFSDECWIELQGKGHSQNRRYRTEKREDVPCTQSAKFDVKVLVDGGFCAGGVSKLHFVPKGQTVTATYYQEHILPVYFETMKSDIFSSKKTFSFNKMGPVHIQQNQQ